MFKTGCREPAPLRTTYEIRTRISPHYTGTLSQVGIYSRLRQGGCLCYSFSALIRLSAAFVHILPKNSEDGLTFCHELANNPCIAIAAKYSRLDILCIARLLLTHFSQVTLSTKTTLLHFTHLYSLLFSITFYLSVTATDVVEVFAGG